MLTHFRFLRPLHFGLLLSSSLALNALALALPLMTMQIYDRVLSNHAEDTLLVLSVGVLMAAVAEFILRICRSVVVGLNGAHFEHEAASHALEKVLEAEPRALSRTGNMLGVGPHGGASVADSTTGISAPMLAQDIGAAARLKDYYGGQMMVTLLVDMPFTLVFLGLAAYLAHWLVLAPLSVLVMFLLVAWKKGVKLQAMMRLREAHDNQRFHFITETLHVIHTVKSFCLEAVTARAFEEVQRESGQVNYRIACHHGQSGSLSYAAAQLMTVIVICAGAPMAIAGHITVGTLIACVLLSGQIMQPLQRGLALWIRFQDIAVAKSRLAALFALPEREWVPTDKLTPNHGTVRVEGVRFHYPGAQALLDGATLSVAPGDTVAITGAPGSGKTTFLELLAGIYHPDRGRVLVSDMEASLIPAHERTRYIAYLPMRGMILRGSIMDNLTGFNPQWRSAARAVADQLGIEEAVALLPSGYDTPLEGNATDVVPPGLKQRISIARALLHKPRLILFDNADHGMDHESYVKIFDLLARLKGKATLVLVSDDRNIVSLADHVYALTRGSLTALTTPPMLLERKLMSGVTL